MLRKFARDRRGVSAVEFALIAPLMILLYYGLSELTMGMMAERRASHAASAMGDLVAQNTQIDAGEMADIFTVSRSVMAPYPTASLKMRVTSVKANAQGTAQVRWSQGSGMGARSGGVGLPSGLIGPNESIIMAEVQYAYTSPIQKALPMPITFNETFYLRPRKTDEVLFF